MTVDRIEAWLKKLDKDAEEDWYIDGGVTCMQVRKLLALVRLYREALDRVDRISKSPAFVAQFQIAALHSCPYKGEQFEINMAEQKALKIILGDEIKEALEIMKDEQ